MVRSVHEVALYTTIHIRYDVLTSRTLRHPGALWSWGCRYFNFYCNTEI